MNVLEINNILCQVDVLKVSATCSTIPGMDLKKKKHKSFFKVFVKRFLGHYVATVLRAYSQQL